MLFLVFRVEFDPVIVEPFAWVFVGPQCFLGFWLRCSSLLVQSSSLRMSPFYCYFHCFCLNGIHIFLVAVCLFFPLALIYSLLLLVHSCALLLLSARQSCNCRWLVSNLTGCIFAQDFSSTLLVTWQLPANDCHLVTGNSSAATQCRHAKSFPFFSVCFTT